jgi:hypothetical protein
MLSVLHDIWCAVLDVPYVIADFLVLVVNLLVAALGAFAAGLIALCPPFPDPPSSPVGGFVGYLNWFFPIGGLLAGLATFMAMWTLFLVVRIGLRWVRAL